ncbi:Uncharacterized membrane protein [Bizionia echini]|uniref:Uncharacterized membrane protein n=1 Tax=Bizionia echini TaxID=649333 RepID=A0A1I5CY41_9FLAO|nr:vitamin K epoxide reductase family protein [Bizionia echini]SFN91868.1 Uncharacterized membrane protein [Bizionia echini]
MQDSLTFLLDSFLKKNKIFIDREELEFQIKSHPSYPSLHTITGVLNHFNIENIAVNVPVNKETLEQLPKSFIAQIRNNNSNDFSLVVKKEKKNKLIFGNQESETISKEIFLKKFTGILVGIEQDETINTNQLKTTNFQKPLFILALVLFILLFFKNNVNILAPIYFILSLAGISISYLIVQHDLGLSSKIVDSICSQESKTTNCNAVLNSKGATLFKNIKLSDLSFIYFISISIGSFLLITTNNSLKSLYVISLAAFPVVIYSIYYQVKISKTWCLLCLGVASVLVCQSLMFLFTDINLKTINIESILLVGFSFSVIASFWLFIVTKLKDEQAYKKLKIESSKFKRNFDLFNTLLQQSETVNTLLPDTSEIVLGNKKAILNITIITNPFCGHCKAVHNLAETILRKHHNELNITIRFNINTNNLETDGVLVSSRLLELFHIESEIKCLEALHEIYNNPDAKSWLQKWKTSSNNDYISILEAEYNWCLVNNINFTPEILINGQSFPKAYDRSDLVFFIEELAEFYQHNRNIETPFILKHI